MWKPGIDLEFQVHSGCERITHQYGIFTIFCYHKEQGATLPALCRSETRGLRRAVHVQAGKSSSNGLDVQLSWPYAFLAVEVGLVAAKWSTPLAVTSILLVIGQSPQDNWLLKTVSGAGVFARYKDAKTFLQVLTVFTVASFLTCCFLLSKA